MLGVPLDPSPSRSGGGSYRHGDSNPGLDPSRIYRLPIYYHDGAVRCHAYVDQEDYARFHSFAWLIRDGRYGYVYRWKQKDGVRWRIYLHREILGLERGDSRRGDHINRDLLDNRRA